MVMNYSDPFQRQRTMYQRMGIFDPRFGGQPGPPTAPQSTAPLTEARNNPAPAAAPDAFSAWQQGNVAPRWGNPQGMPTTGLTTAPGAASAQQRPVAAPTTTNADTGGWALPQGWDASKNRYTFNLEGKAWTNPGNMLYVLGYNQAKDGAKIPTAAGNETEFNRVYGFMNAVAKANGIADISQAPEALQKWAMNYAVGRLKTDYLNSDPSGRAWAGSAFSGFDANQNAPYAPATGTPGARPPQQVDPTTGSATHTPGATGAGKPGTTPGGPLPPGYQGSGGGGGGLTAAQRMALASDPNQAYRYMMQQIGYNPDAPGLLGKFLEQRFKPLLEARMAASGLEGASGVNGEGGLSSNYMDNIGNTINDFGSGAFARGGDFFGNLAAIGNNAARNAGGVLGQLKDQSQAMQYLQQLGSLRYAGSNPLFQQAAADMMQRGQNRYQDYAFNNELVGKNIDPFTRWLLEQSEYRGIYGL